MDDKSIVDLFWQRNELAITKTEEMYGTYLAAISFRILGDQSDAEECVNDTYNAAWNSIPPHKPAVLSTYLGKLTRRISLKKLRSRSAQKRGGNEFEVSLDELAECIPAGSCLDNAIELKELTNTINTFLSSLPVDERRVFILRYWHALPILSISKQLGYSKSKVESMLHRTRVKLKRQLEKEGYFL